MSRWKVFGHEDVPDNLEAELSPEVMERPSKVEPEAVRIKNSNTAIDALGEVMQMMRAVVVVLPGHHVILGARGGAYIKKRT